MMCVVLYILLGGVLGGIMCIDVRVCAWVRI